MCNANMNGINMDKRSAYVRGVGVGLIISWVTSVIAYLRGGQSAILFDLILFELLLSVILLLISVLINTERGKGKKH
jgi:hypothetical protein